MTEKKIILIFLEGIFYAVLVVFVLPFLLSLDSDITVVLGVALILGLILGFILRIRRGILAHEKVIRRVRD